MKIHTSYSVRIQGFNLNFARASSILTKRLFL